MATDSTAEIAQALWYVAPGQAEIREERLAAPRPGEVRVRALFGALSRGTEALVLAGRVPDSEFERMRATCGITAAIESDEKRKIKNPTMAFQNPATIQCNVIANNTISVMSIVLKPAGDSASAASAINPTMVTAIRAANSTRLPAMAFPVASACVDWSSERSNTRLQLLISGGPCKLDDITQQMYQ